MPLSGFGLMRVLVVEDEGQLCEDLRQVLEHAGYVTDTAQDGLEAVRLGLTEVYDCVVLDLGLPQMDGVSVLQRWREDGMGAPVLILTARSRWSDKLAGFNAGADDYLVKPINMDEILLRVRALIRRAAGHFSPMLTFGPLTLDTNSGRVTVSGVPLALTPQEFRILEYMMHHPGRLVTRSGLVNHVYDRNAQQSSNVVDVLISRIRRKLNMDIIQTVRGQGYRLAVPKA